MSASPDSTSTAGVRTATPAKGIARARFRKTILRNRYLILLFLPSVAYFAIFHYLPMAGIVIAFKDYSPYLGFIKSPWVGLQQFEYFFQSFYAWRIVRNTLLLNLYSLAFGFPAPILFALLLNELYGTAVKRVAQTVTYFPYFLSSTIIAGLVVQVVGPQGMVNDLLGGLFNMAPVRFLEQPGFFRPIYVAANIWKGLGFGTIIYLAAMTGIDPEQYEAAVMDGAGRLRRLWHVTIPALVPTMVVLFLLNLGSLMSVGIELVLLLYNPLTYETADVIDTFVYRRGIGVGGTADYSFGTAVGLFQGLIGLLLIIFFNQVAKKLGETSLW